jgi:hypothetical protein
MSKIDDQDLISRCKEGKGAIIANYDILYGCGSDNGKFTFEHQGEIVFRGHKVPAETPTSLPLVAYSMQFRHFSSYYGNSVALYRCKRSDDQTTFFDFKHLDHSYFIGKSTYDPGEDALTIKFNQKLIDDNGKEFLEWWLNREPGSEVPVLYGCAKFRKVENHGLSEEDKEEITKHFGGSWEGELIP